MRRTRDATGQMNASSTCMTREESMHSFRLIFLPVPLTCLLYSTLGFRTLLPTLLTCNKQERSSTLVGKQHWYRPNKFAVNMIGLCQALEP